MIDIGAKAEEWKNVVTSGIASMKLLLRRSFQPL
jgi:hypothetical protein